MSMRHVLALAGLLLWACGPSSVGGSSGGDGGSGGGGGGGGTDADDQCQGADCINHCPAGSMTTISGKVTMPNGIDPVPGAMVYVPREVTEFPGEVRCEVCSQLSDSAIVSTESAVDGSFTLGPIPTGENQQPGFTTTVVAQIGRFRKLAEVVISAPCGQNTAAAGDFRLPSRNQGFDNIPAIAVGTGDYDVMECVLLKLGIDQDAFDLYDGVAFGSTPGAMGSLDALLSDLARMKTYNIIFLNCADNTYENLLTNAAIRENIESYVLSGGRLYVTDWSYDYIEQEEQFCPIIDFGPSVDTNPSAPEPMNAAAIGNDGITTEALVLDDGLAAWLRAVEAVAASEIIDDQGRVHIEHFLGGWVMQYDVPEAESVKVWLRGNVTGDGLSGDLPLTTTFDYEACGRVLYSSYHTAGRDFEAPEAFPDYCSSAPLSPQERVLEYLILHIADCIEID